MNLKTDTETNTMTEPLVYTIVGSGRCAKHLRFYLQSQNIRVFSWNRKNSTTADLERMASQSDVVLILIKDSEIKNFVDQNAFLKQKDLVHFSGALVIPGLVGLHPLMTFSEKLYSPDFYKKIPFISEKNNKKFLDIFPQLENPNFEIEPQLKALYHSLCVMSGNFTTLLWQKVFTTFDDKLELSPEILFPYLEKIVENIKSDYKSALTGPITRKDAQTVQKNLAALQGDAYFEVYKSFLKATDPDFYKDLYQ